MIEINELDLSIANDVCYSFVIENGYQQDKHKSNYKYSIHLQMEINCDKGKISYFVEHLFTGEKTYFENYRKALGYFYSLINEQ